MRKEIFESKELDGCSREEMKFLTKGKDFLHSMTARMIMHDTTTLCLEEQLYVLSQHLSKNIYDDIHQRDQ